MVYPAGDVRNPARCTTTSLTETHEPLAKAVARLEQATGTQSLTHHVPVPGKRRQSRLTPSAAHR